MERKIFDFCGTVVSEKNSTKSFIYFIHKKRKSYLKFFVYWLFSSVTSRLFNSNYMNCLIRSIKGMSKTELSLLAKEYSLAIAEHGLNTEVLGIIKDEI